MNLSHRINKEVRRIARYQRNGKASKVIVKAEERLDTLRKKADQLWR